MPETHTTFLNQREPTAEESLSYAEWEHFVKVGFGADDLDALGLKLAWRYRWYLTGFSVKALTTSWKTPHCARERAFAEQNEPRDSIIRVRITVLLLLLYVDFDLPAADGLDG
jgi:hypothetical protein